MRITRKSVLAAVVASLALGACGGTTDSKSADPASTEVKLAFFGALTGDSAGLGINIRNGALLAINKYNAANPKVKVSLQSFDSQGDPAQAPSLATKAVSQKDILGVIGPAFSGETKAVGGIFNDAGLTSISASATNPGLTKNGWGTFFQALGNDNTQGPAAAKYISEVIKSKKVAVIDDGSEYGQGLARIVKTALGTAVITSDTVDKDETELSSVVTKIKGSGADTVFYGGYYGQAGLLRKQLTESGVTAKLVVGDGVKQEEYITAAGASAEGTIFTCPCIPGEKAAGTFAADYQKAYNREPGTYSAEAFDAAQIYLDAITAGKLTRSEILSFVKAYDKPGLTKQLRFTDNGESAEVVVWSYKAVAGKIVPEQVIK